MPDVNLLGPWIKRFLLEYVQSERNLSLHTQKSYRDTLVQLIPFLAARGKRKPECLSLADLSRDSLRLFSATSRSPENAVSQPGTNGSPASIRLPAMWPASAPSISPGASMFARFPLSGRPNPWFHT